MLEATRPRFHVGALKFGKLKSPLAMTEALKPQGEVHGSASVPTEDEGEGSGI